MWASKVCCVNRVYPLYCLIVYRQEASLPSVKLLPDTSTAITPTLNICTVGNCLIPHCFLLFQSKKFQSQFLKHQNLFAKVGI